MKEKTRSTSEVKGNHSSNKKSKHKKGQTNQQVFDYVIPKILKQGRCWAPGFGCRYELAPGHYWTGEIYQEATVLSNKSLSDKYIKNLRDDKKVGVVTKFAGDRVYKKARYHRYDTTLMFFSGRSRRSQYAWKSLHTEIVEGNTCDSGFMFSVISRLGLDVDFFRGMQIIHDDLSLNTKKDWIEKFDILSRRFALGSGVRKSWIPLVNQQDWDYNVPERQRAIELYR